MRGCGQINNILQYYNYILKAQFVATMIKVCQVHVFIGT